jgi:hypothetical protein
VVNPLSEIATTTSSASTFELPAYLQQQCSILCETASQPLDILWNNSLPSGTECNTTLYYEQSLSGETAACIAADADIRDGLHFFVFVIPTFAWKVFSEVAYDCVFIALV